MVTVRDADNGAKALKARLKKGLPSGVVGVYGDLAAQKHKDSPRAAVGQIAAAHEFGLGYAPMRSWMRRTFTEHKEQVTRGLEKICVAAITGESDPRLMMQQLTLAAAGWCKQTIIAGIPPALKPDYLKRKLARYPGATTPLIASGQMLGSIAGEVENK
jgi:hypothetical protein